VLHDETRLPALTASVAALDTSLASADLRLAELMTLGTSLPLDIAAIETELASATLRASRAADAAAALERATAARSAAVLAIATTALVKEAALGEKAASSAHLASVVDVDDLLTRRLGGYAAELATALVNGEPCAVCGSVAHPAPAPRVDDAVTEGDVALARARSTELGAASSAASNEVHRLMTALATAAAKADGLDVEAADVAVAAASSAVDDARAAAAEQETLGSSRDVLRGRLEGNAGALDELRAAREELVRALAEARTTCSAIAERVSRASEGFDSVADRVERLMSTANAARSLSEAISAEGARVSAVAVAAESLAAQVASQRFADAEAATAARLDAASLVSLEARIRSHDARVAAAIATIAEAADIPDEPVDVELSRDDRRVAGEVRDAALTAKASIEARKVELDTAAKDAAAELAISGGRRAEYDRVRELAAVVAGNEPNEKRMRLESFVLAAQLEEIVAAANLRLHRMTGGRFALEHDDALQFRGARSGLSLAIRDEHTGRSRATHSLSGGETFLASLALALGLAEVVTNQAGGIRLDTLFVDEGFGSLDGETLEIAMTTLDGLRAGGRTIGLISHVEAMKEQIPAKLLIRVTDKGYSEIG
jgi:exonuclease SbcC